MSRLVNPDRSYQRWVSPYHSGLASTSNTVTAGRIYLLAFAIDHQMSVDAITYLVGAASVGNVRAGIYAAVSEDTANGATLVVQSSEVAQGSTNAPQTVPLTSTLLAPGRYYMALEFSDATGTVLRQVNQTQVTGWTQFVDQTYGALPSTISSPTNSAAVVPGGRTRVVQP